MTSAWFLGAQQSVPQDEAEARSTVEPIRTDPAGAEDSAPPDWNERDSDESGQLIGLAPRVVGSFTVPIEKSPPVNPEMASVRRDNFDLQAVQGTAALREMAGQRGHGSMQYEIGIDPLNPAQRYGNEYFQREAASANEGSGDYMTPIDGDHWSAQVAQSQAVERSRAAARSTLYNNFFAS